MRRFVIPNIPLITTFDPDFEEHLSCIQRIKYLQDKANNPNLQLRVSVDGGGCSGFQYRFEMQPEVKEDDDK